MQINIIHLKFHDIYIIELFYDEMILVDCNWEILIISGIFQFCLANIDESVIIIILIEAALYIFFDLIKKWYVVPGWFCQ